MSDWLLWKAVYDGNTEKVKGYLEREADPNNPQYWKEEWMNEEFGKWTTRPPPVHLACANGSLDILKLLLQGGANVDVGGGLYSMTPLHWACDGGHKDVAAFLISKTGCRVDVMDKNNMTPFLVGCWKGHKDVIQYLAEVCKCNLDVRDKYDRCALHLACEGGNLETVQYLVGKRNCDIDVRDWINRTPLHCASWEGHKDVVQYLVEEQKGDTNVKDEDNSTPLHYACERGHKEVVQYLVEEQKCDFELTDKRGYSPLKLAVQNSKSFHSSRAIREGCTEIVDYLTTLSQTSKPALTILMQPKDALTNLGDSVEFSIEASPVATTYAWHFQEKLITAEDINYDGYDTDKLLILKCLPKHRGVYKCILTDEAGESFVSASGTLKFVGETMSSDESTLLGQILIKSGLNLDDYGIDVKHLAEGNIELTYVEMQCMLKDNPKTCILSLNLKEELKTRLEEDRLYKEAMANDQQVSLSYTKILALGPGQVGKSTFLYRLMGLMKSNIQLSDPETQPQSSTGIAELREACITYTSRTGALTSDSWQVFDEKSDLQCQLDGLMSLLVEQSSSNRTDEDLPGNKKQKSSDSVEVSSDTDKSNHLQRQEEYDSVDFGQLPDQESDLELTEEVKSEQAELQTTSATSPTSTSSTSYPLPEMSNIDLVIKEFEKIRADCMLIPSKTKFHMLFNIADIGGQPAFLEMLPSLTIGPALYLVFMKLLQGLTTRYPVAFKCKDGRGSKLCKNYTYTSEEVIFTALSSIACFGNFDEEVEQFVTNTGEMKRTRSHAVLVGTFSDEVEDEKELKSIDNQLKKQLEVTDFFNEGLIHSKSFLRVNNFSAEDSEIQEQRNLLEEILERKFHRYEIPTRWLTLSICLKLLSRREEKFEISFDDCVKLGSRLSMKEDMVKVALQFLHKYIGLVMYFPNNDHLKNLVICDPQIVFTSISELIFDIYDPRNMYITEAQHDYFVRTGCFSPQEINTVDKEESKQSTLSIETLVHLLVHLNIIAEVPSNLDNESVDTVDDNMAASQKKFYFLPAVLQTAEISLLKREITEERIPEPLCIRFPTGYLPLGFVCALSANLIAESNSFKLIPFKEGDHRVTYKNMMKFRFLGKFDITMVSGPKYCEFRVTKWSGNTEFWDKDCCPRIKTIICEAADRVIKSLKYGSLYKPLKDVSYILAFRCPKHENPQIGHEPLAKFLYNDTTKSLLSICPDEMLCTNPMCATRCKLSPEMKMWFGEAISAPNIIKEPTLEGKQMKILVGGTKPMKYQWFKGETELSDGEDYKGSTTSELSIIGIGPQVTGMYKCLVVNKYGNASSRKVSYNPFAKELKQMGLMNNEICKLIDNGIMNLEELKSLTVDDVKEIHLNLGEKKRVLKLVSSLQTSKRNLETMRLSSQDPTSKLGTLRRALWKVRSKWEDVGIDLGIATDTLEAIETDHAKKVDKCFTAMLRVWLLDDPNVDDLLESLRGPVVGRADLADELEKMIETGELLL